MHTLHTCKWLGIWWGIIVHKLMLMVEHSKSNCHTECVSVDWYNQGQKVITMELGYCDMCCSL